MRSSAGSLENKGDASRSFRFEIFGWRKDESEVESECDSGGVNGRRNLVLSFAGLQSYGARTPLFLWLRRSISRFFKRHKPQWRLLTTEPEMSGMLNV